jgi:phage replication O-like protein O
MIAEYTFTKIPNDELEKLNQINLSSAKRRVIGVIQRRTYGFQKARAWITEKVFATESKMDNRNAAAALKILIENNIVTVRIDGKKHYYNMNRDLAAWAPSKQTAKTPTVQTDGENTSKQTVEKSISPSKQTDIKESIKETFKETPGFSDQNTKSIGQICFSIPLFHQFSDQEKSNSLKFVKAKLTTSNGGEDTKTQVQAILNQFADKLMDEYGTTQQQIN